MRRNKGIEKVMGDGEQVRKKGKEGEVRGDLRKVTRGGIEREKEGKGEKEGEVEERKKGKERRGKSVKATES